MSHKPITAAKAHPVKNLSGGGFAFEDRVGAWVAAAMLTGATPLDPELGPPTRIDFQVDADGWRLDDLLVSFADARWCASIKSYAQIDAGKAATDFVTRAWEEILGLSGSGFNTSADLLGMVTAPIDARSLGDVHDLIQLARAQEPENLAVRIRKPGYKGKRQGTLWDSFAMPASLGPAEGRGVTTSPGEVLRRLRIIEADFDRSPSRLEEQALRWCGDALADPNEAPALWDALLVIVSQGRTPGGLLTRPILGAQLRRRFELRDHPAYERDWSVLREITARNTDQVADRLGGRLHIDRSGDIARINDHTAQPASLLALVGPSGCGKTALAKAWAASIGGAEVVWLQPDDVAAVAQPGGPLRHSLVDVLRSACNGGWIVVDGLDRSFSNGAYQAVAHLVTALVSDDTLFFRMLVTSQQQEWARVTDRLADYNAAVAWDAIPVGTFSDADLKQVADTFPALRGVMLRGRLAGVLRNPKVLDVVVRHLTGGVAVGESMIHDEASFAGWFYDRLVRGSGGRRAGRGVLVMRLAEIQGDRLQAETSLLDLDAATLDHVDDLERDGVCQQHDGRLRFGHDLYGDWVRYQLLRNHHDDLPDYLRGRLSSPLWHRAIRLHSLAVLAAHQAEEWRTEMRRLGGDTLGLLHDAFLEAPLFAAEPGPALEKVWPVLIDDDGRLLRRLIGRFLHIATVPNPALLATIRDVDPDLETHMATMQRLPYWPLWLPLLEALSAHADDALEVAGDEVARLVDIWLRTVPDTWPWCPEAAALAIAGGRRVLESKGARRYGAKDRETRAWRAVLAAVRERHDDVVEIASTLTRPAGTEDEQPDHPGGTQDQEPDEEVDEPPAHGQRGVDQTFSDACLNTNALHPVIATDPKLAGDILFAILAPRPRRRSRFGGDLPWDKLGMDRLPNWLIPLYTRGPFLAFLRTAPAEARAFTLRLVEAATDRWVEVRHDGGASVSGIEVPLGNTRTLTVRGDEQVLQWYRGDSRVPSTLASALMSLEKWLYDEADAGHDIGPVVRELLESATSVAIVGLLTALGCRHPELLQGPLRPLLGVPELYLWDRWYKSSDQSHLLIGLVGEPAQVRQLAHEWYSLEHRRTTLMEVAQRLMLTDHGVAAFLAEARGRWRERLDDQGEPATLRFLIPGLDPANWKEKTHPQGFSYWEYEEPEELRAESQRAVQEANQQAFWLMMPMRCRKILDGELSLRDEDLEDLWDTVQSRASIPPDNDGSDESVITREDTECGLAAVLMVRHREWLRRHPERERWCIDRMVEAVSGTRERHWSDSPESGFAWSWDAFCADALPIRWAEQPEDPLLREAIVHLALNMHYKTIVRLFAAAGQWRDTLGDDFRRLQHLAVHIACFRVAMEVARDDGARSRAVAALSPHIDGFINATLEPVVPAWAELAVPTDGPRRRGWFKLDPAYLQAAYAWMPPLEEAHDQRERAEWIEHWHQSVQALVRRLHRNIDPQDGEVEGTPYEPEYALLRALPARIIQMRPDEARAIWEPILALGGIAHYWVESFLDHWFMVGLQTIPAPDEFVREWQAMLDYTEGAEAWSGARRSYRVAELRRHLMGLDGFVLDLWTEGQEQVVERMAPHYHRWALRSLDGSQDATQFARFLRRPGATHLVVDGLIWLAAAEGSASSSRADNHYEDAVGTLLDHVARHQRDIPRSAGAVGDAYRTLLKRLADRQVPIALELASRLSSLTGPAWDS